MIAWNKQRGEKKMEFVLAPSNFKGTLSSIQVIEMLSKVINSFDKKASIISFPLADGGDGTLDSYKFLYKNNYQEIKIEASGPFYHKDIYSSYLIVNKKTAVIESCKFCGLALAGDKSNPSLTTTYGVGEAIIDALNKGIRDFKIGIGGSSTNDLGSGMACSLGVRFLNRNLESFLPTGGTLNEVTHIDISNLDKRIMESTFTILSDVENPLLGTNGATYVYALQKGASKKDLPVLEANMNHLNEVIKKDLHLDFSKEKGAGAAGGLGLAAKLYLKGTIKSGAVEILEESNFQNSISSDSLVITGEGHIDRQTLSGKTISRIARICKIKKVPLLAIGGIIDEEIKPSLIDLGVTDFLTTSTKKYPTFKELKENASKDLIYSFKSYFFKHYQSLKD